VNKKVFSTIIIAGVFSFIANQSFATEQTDTPDNFSGFYVNLGAGININSMSNDTSKLQYEDLDPEDADEAINFSDNKHNLSASPMALQLQGGWGKIFKQKYYYGGFLGMQSANFSEKTTKTSLFTRKDEDTENYSSDKILNVKQNSPSYMMGLKLGYLLSPKALLWAGLGVSETTLKLSTTEQLSGTLEVPGEEKLDLSSTPAHYDKSASVIGMSYAVGFNYSFMSHWSSFVNYTLTNYQSVNFNNTSNITITGSPVDGGAPETHKMKVTSNQKVSLFTQSIMLGATYQF
jgi:opacity protein-like surface antigen